MVAKILSFHCASSNTTSKTTGRVSYYCPSQVEYQEAKACYHLASLPSGKDENLGFLLVLLFIPSHYNLVCLEVWPLRSIFVSGDEEWGPHFFLWCLAEVEQLLLIIFCLARPNFTWSLAGEKKLPLGVFVSAPLGLSEWLTSSPPNLLWGSKKSQEIQCQIVGDLVLPRWLLFFL